MTNSATVTISIGLPALAPVAMVFAESSGKFFYNVTNPFRLPGLSHLDNFIMTRISCSFIGTMQKPMSTRTQTATYLTAGPL
jgi:hypothetical protein